MKKTIVSLLVVIAIVAGGFFSCFALETTDKNGYPIYAVTSEAVVSQDKRFSYVLDKNSSNAYFYASLENDITVLEIPDEIDGYKILGIKSIQLSSDSITAIKFGKNVENAFQYSLNIHAESQNPLPVCTLEINDGFRYFSRNAGVADPLLQGAVPVACKTVIMPESLEYIGENGFPLSLAQQLVIQSNLTAPAQAMTVQNLTDEAREVYFSKSVKNVSPSAFDYSERNDPTDENAPILYPFNDVSIYGKSAEELRRFYGDEYKQALTENDFGWSQAPKKALPEGYTVKEYTEEWWHGLAEIEEVTMTAEGMSEKTEQVGNGLSDSARKYLSHEYEKSVKSGEKFTVSSAFAPSDAYDDRTFFVSMDETVATVDTETGEVTALKKGTARIRCVAASGVFSDCILKVDGGGLSNGIDTFDANKVFDGGISFDYLEAYVKLNKTKLIVAAVCVVAAAAILTAAVIVIKKKKC